MNVIRTIRNNLLIFAFAFLGSFPLAASIVSNVTISSRWPWEGKVDINYTIGGKKDVPCKVAFYGMGDNDMEFALTTLSGDGAEGTVPGAGTYRATWDAKADLPKASYQAFKVKVKAESASKPRIRVTVGEHSFEADLRDNAAAEAFWDKLPLTLSMNELNGNEKYCYGVSLPSEPEYYDKIEPGELMLYGSNCIVLFYGKAGGYSYTRIGKLTSAEGLAEAVGSGAVSVTFDKAKAAEKNKEKNK